ncbi:RVP_2 domain-containing protein [Cephalotus follicularis]|uniref:RVP_2 domain-containing protein n=1 Tax=Cephalotus follicularis TaxID=3775 RepID=A0A1Q3AZM9_CEPFO|nr:RVP_2 domain-containing protein [Cephalotus follicularis]
MNCPQAQQTSTMLESTASSRESVGARGGSTASQVGSSKASGSRQQGRHAVTARVYALNRVDALGSANVAIGKDLIFGKDATVLFDTGASLSFVAQAFCIHACGVLSSVDEEIVVSVPTGQSYRVGRVYKGCDVVVKRQSFIADLIPFKIEDFDAILGMICW